MKVSIARCFSFMVAVCAFLGASETFGADDVPGDTCISEDCLIDGFSSAGDGFEGWYLRVLKAKAKGFRLDDASSSFRQMYATAATFVGAYEEAEKYYPIRIDEDDPVGEGHVHAVDAAPVISRMMKGRRAVFINESHAVIRTRAVIYGLLGLLRANGFTHLAIEGLAVKPPQGGGSCSDSIMSDENLALRGYPLVGSGFYIREPVYSEIIKEALRLGFHLVAHETLSSSGTAEREQQLAENLACVYEADRSARLAVIAGFAHISKEPDYRVEGGLMAARFRKMTGVNPLTIDTTRLLQLSGDGLVFENASSAADSLKAYALADDDGRFYGSKAYDLMLFLPKGNYRSASGESWLSLGARERVRILPEGCDDSWPCIIETFSDEGDIPVDGCISNGEACFIFTDGGRGHIRYFHGE